MSPCAYFCGGILLNISEARSEGPISLERIVCVATGPTEALVHVELSRIL
jgi:hypothetical protein